MNTLAIVLVALLAIVAVGLLLSIRIVKQYEQGVVLSFRRVLGPRPGPARHHPSG